MKGLALKIKKTLLNGCGGMLAVIAVFYANSFCRGPLYEPKVPEALQDSESYRI